MNLAFCGNDVDLNCGHCDLLLVLLGVFHSFVDPSAVGECLLRNVIVVAGNDAVEAANGFRQWYVFARRVGEDFSNRERLRKEFLDLARTINDLFVVLRQLIHAQDSDDVLQFLITLQYRLYATRAVIMLLTNDQRIENPRR